ncbi:MAG: DUF4340 domain-containing protein [Verrucomicrobiota bacterium]
MRLINTAILGLVAIVLGIVIHFVDQKPDVGARAAQLANVLVRFPIEQIEMLKIAKGDRLVVAEKMGGGWFFTAPEQDRADAPLIQALLDQINNLPLADTLESGEIEGSGLSDRETIRVRLFSDDEKEPVASFALGGEAPKDNALYASRDGDSAVHVIDAGTLRPWLELPLLTLRDRNVLGAPVERVVQLVVRQPTGQIALQRRITQPPSDWAIADPIQVWADPDKVDRLLSELAAIQFDEVLPDAPADADLPNPLPENSALVQLMVYGVEQPLTLFLRQVAEPAEDDPLPRVEVRMSDRPSVYRLSSDFLANLPETPNEIRSRALAPIPREYLESIAIQSRIDPDVVLFAQQTENGPRWRLKDQNRLREANNNLVGSLIDGVNDAAILEFVSDEATDLETYGLVPPARRVTFNLKVPGQADESGDPAPPQQLSRVLNLGWQDAEDARLFASFEGEPHVYELDPGFLSLVPSHPLKWRSLSVLSFNSFQLRGIKREVVGREPLELAYNYQIDQWDATRGGESIRGILDRSSARTLRDRLGSLTAATWNLSLASAYEALAEPSAVFTIATSELDRATGEPVDSETIVRFAKSSTDRLYFGQVDGQPDVFMIDQSLYQELIEPITGTVVLP